MSEPADEYPPRPPRTAMVANVDVFRNGARLGTARTRNVSAKGLGAVGFLPLRINELVTVELDGQQRIPAKVIWQQGSNFGLKLDEEVDVDDFGLATTLSGERRQI